MQHLGEHVASILNGGVVHLHLNVDGSTVDVVGISIAVGRPDGNDALLPFKLVFFDDTFKTFTLVLKLTAESCKCRCGKIPGHAPSLAVGM